MITRRTAIKGAVVAALAAQPIRNASAMVEEFSPIVDKPQPLGRALYGPRHLLAHGETVMIPEAPEKPILAVEEVSRRTLHNSDRLFVPRDGGTADLLRCRLHDESTRYCAVEWSSYKHQLRKIEQMLLAAGVDGETAKWAIDDLDCAAVGLHITGMHAMLDVGIKAGRSLADESQPFPLILPGDRTCKTCHGSGGLGHECVTCDGTGLVDEPGPDLMLLVIPDGVALEEAEHEAMAAAA